MHGGSVVIFIMETLCLHGTLLKRKDLEKISSCPGYFKINVLVQFLI